jgi:hypothetical protein
MKIGQHNASNLGKRESRRTAVKRLHSHWTLLQTNVHKVRRLLLMAVCLTDMTTAFVSWYLFIYLSLGLPSLIGKYSTCFKIPWACGVKPSTILLYFSSISQCFVKWHFKEGETPPKRVEKTNRALLSCTECHKRKQKVTISISDGKKLSKVLRKAIGLTLCSLLVQPVSTL